MYQNIDVFVFVRFKTVIGECTAVNDVKAINHKKKQTSSFPSRFKSRAKACSKIIAVRDMSV